METTLAGLVAKIAENVVGINCWQHVLFRVFVPRGGKKTWDCWDSSMLVWK